MNFIDGIRRRSALISAIVIFAIFNCAFANDDEYLAEAKNTCYETHDTYSCFKFRSLRFVSGVASGSIWPQSANESARSVDMRSFNLVPIKNFQVPIEHGESSFFGDSRQMKNDSEFDKFIKFAKRQLELYMTSHGITFGLPDGATTIPYEEYSSNEIARSLKESARGKKKKLAMLLPLLSLFSLFKVKLLLVPILLTVLFIKKILVLSVLFLPSILSTLKICKMQNMSGSHGQWASSEATQDYSSGYGGGYPAAYGGGGSQAGYSKDWGTNRAYGGYKSTYEPSAAYKTISDMASYASPSSNAMYNSQ